MKGSASPERPIERGGRGETRRDATRDADEAPAVVALGECCTAIRGVTFSSGDAKPQAFDGCIGCLTTSGVQDEVAWASARFIPDHYMRGPHQELRPGDLLVSTANSKALVGKLALVRDVPGRMTFGAFVTVLRPSAHVSPRYLFLCLRSERARRYFFEKSSETTNISNLGTDDMLALEIPLPPLAEQERIAGRLTEQLGAVERARAAAAQRLAAAEALPAALLREVFDGPQASGWETRTLGDLGPLQTGFAFKSEWFKPDGVRILRNANIHQGFLEWDDVVRVPESMTDRFAAFSLEVGDIVLTLDRPLVANGLKVARITPDDLPSLLNQRVARFRFDPAQLDADYLYAFLRSALFIDAIRGHDQSLGVPHISPAQVEAVELPLPDLPTQRRLAAELTQRLAAAEGVIARCREELAAIEALPASLLRDAFGGGRESEAPEGA